MTHYNTPKLECELSLRRSHTCLHGVDINGFTSSSKSIALDAGILSLFQPRRVLSSIRMRLRRIPRRKAGGRRLRSRGWRKASVRHLTAGKPVSLIALSGHAKLMPHVPTAATTSSTVRFYTAIDPTTKYAILPTH